MPFKPQAFIFDAYGTLFDVHSVVQREHANLVGDLQALSELWRQKQLEYTWLRALMERYEDFWQVTESALRFAVRRLSINATDSQLERLMEAYLSPARATRQDPPGGAEGIEAGHPPERFAKDAGLGVRSNGLESY